MKLLLILLISLTFIEQSYAAGNSFPSDFVKITKLSNKRIMFETCTYLRNSKRISCRDISVDYFYKNKTIKTNIFYEGAVSLASKDLNSRLIEKIERGLGALGMVTGLILVVIPTPITVGSGLLLMSGSSISFRDTNGKIKRYSGNVANQMRAKEFREKIKNSSEIRISTNDLLGSKAAIIELLRKYSDYENEYLCSLKDVKRNLWEKAKCLF